MTAPPRSCVLLADRHHQLIEGVRDMLEATADSLFIVANERSLLEGASRLQPTVVILDLSLIPGRLRTVIHQVRGTTPDTKVLLLTIHEDESAASFALVAGADGIVLKRSIATDLLPAVSEILAHRAYVSPEIRRPASVQTPDAAEGDAWKCR